MLILWADAPCTVSHIGERALLNTNTVIPLLKRLEHQGYVRRQRCREDERVVDIHLTEAGRTFKSRCQGIPIALSDQVDLPSSKVAALSKLLDELLLALTDNQVSGR